MDEVVNYRFTVTERVDRRVTIAMANDLDEEKKLKPDFLAELIELGLEVKEARQKKYVKTAGGK